MSKIIFLLFFPLFLFSKVQILTYFPLEAQLVKKIAQIEAVPREITNRYLPEFRKIPSSEISRLSNSKIYFHFGLDVEKQYENILKEKNPNLIIVDMSKDVDKINNNPYIWMDPFAMRIVAKNIYEAFIEIDKNNKDFYQENYEKFLDEIDDTFLKIKQKMAGSDVTTIYSFDDYWDYFSNRFRVNIIKKEKKYLNVTDVSTTLEFTQNKNIKKLLFYRGMDYNIALSLSNNLNVKIIEDDIFADKWQFNLLNLSQNLFK
ncbi:MAG: zinc ABC transporter substrate-binding protein [Aliarcobacter sp.]|jgi:zinc transport system substrate-binding protein|nr:zinc ABC transporter substrate-binding protein [Aliarcobacter sp.]